MFKKYDAYKDSGIDWVGKIPAHWNVLKLGGSFEQRNQKVSDKDYPALSVTKNGIVPQLDNAAKTKDGDNRKLVLKGDFVINSRSDRKGSSGLSSLDGSVSLINIVLKPRKIEPKFSHHLMKCNAFIEEYYRVGRGIVADLWTTRFEEMKTMNLALPSVDEQRQIADFLDQRLVEIDQAIAIKEQQIALLNERKQIVIQKAVTQGLKPNVAMKDSGVEWIGQIPEHWEIMKLKYLISKLESGVSVNASESESASEKDIGVLKTSAVYKYMFDPNENKKVFKNEIRRVSCPVKAGSIIVSRMNAPDLVGASGYVEKDYPNLYLPDRLWPARFYTSDVEVPRFVSHILVTKGIRSIIESLATGSSPSMKNISKNDFLNIEIALPPVNEILELNSFIRDRDFEYMQSIKLFKKQIEKLKEYKTTLINDAVTGKIKVA